MLRWSGDRGHLCLVPDLSGKVLSFSPLSQISAVELLLTVFFKLRIFLLFLVYYEFLSSIGVGLYQNAFIAPIDIVM